MSAVMTDYPIEPELVVRDGPRLSRISEALVFARQMVDQRSLDLWKDTVRRLEAVRSEEDALEAAGALSEVLEIEDLLMPSKERQHALARAKQFPFDPPMRMQDGRMIGSLDQAAMVVRELLAQRPDPQWEHVLRQLESVRSQEDGQKAVEAVRHLLEAEHLLVET
jgi:hypothetical protein